jgi:hypothetical protein
MATWNDIEIGCETFQWLVEDNRTFVNDEEGDRIFYLRWEATENEVRAAIYAHAQGFKNGEKVGRLAAKKEIRTALGIDVGEVI